MKTLKRIHIEIITLFFLTACSAKSRNTQITETQTFPVTRLIAKDTTLQQGYVSNIQAVRNVEIRARVTGFLDEIYIDEGQEVKRGQLLFKINDVEYKAELAREKANLSSTIAEAKAAELEVARVKMLVEKKVISKSELEVARTKLNAAQARIKEARSAVANATTRLSYTSIRAPFNGLIYRIPLKAGSLIEEGSLLTSVSDIHTVYAYFNVSEDEYLRYIKTLEQHPGRASQEVSLVLADGSNYPHKGSVQTIQSEFDESTGSIAFRASFPNPEKLLKHGATGRVFLTTAVDSAVLLPQKSVFEIQDKNYVFLLDKNNRIKMHSFIPGKRFSKFYIVKSGLKAGDRVVYEGIQNLRDGMSVNPRYVPMKNLFAVKN
jgi:membrane fusion protein (multidrug efflux system)